LEKRNDLKRETVLPKTVAQDEAELEFHAIAKEGTLAINRAYEMLNVSKQLVPAVMAVIWSHSYPHPTLERLLSVLGISAD
jgi:hypothetical protein